MNAPELDEPGLYQGERRARASRRRAGALRGAAPEDVPHGAPSNLLDWDVPGDPQEAGGREVMVEREGMPDTLRAHDGEARRVDEGEVLVRVLTQQTERPCFGLAMDEYLLEPLRIFEVVEEPHRRCMTAHDAQERVGLPDHVVRGEIGRASCRERVYVLV